jgi:hypothetical protein
MTSTQIAAISVNLRRHSLEPVGLPPAPPSSAEAFRELTRGAVCALLDFDQPSASLEWQNAFRTRRPTLPLLALFENAALDDLLPAGIEGLDGALRLPVRDAIFDRFIEPWVPASASTATGSSGSPHDSNDAMSFSSQAKTPPLPARYLSPLSSANQDLLRKIVENPQCNRFIIQGPENAEFHLAALELAAHRGFDESAVRFDDRDDSSAEGLLVTSDVGLFRRTGAPCALLIDSKRLIEPATTNVVLVLRPLYRRPQDTAFYVKRWLPVLASASHRSDAAKAIVPLNWCHALLTCAWPGEFEQLWNTLQRLALLPDDGSLPPPLDAPGGSTGFDNALHIATARAYKARLAGRIPAGLLPAVLSALGCPDIPDSHA